MKLTVKSTLVGVLALGLSASSAMAQEVTLRFQHFLGPKSDMQVHFMEPWANKIMEESGGRIKIEIYPAMQLGGGPPALYDQIRDGVIDGGWALPAYTPGRFPESEVFELPFMTSTNAEATSRASWEFAQKYAQERFSDVHMIATHVHGPGVIHVKGDPIATVADFNGLKLRGPSRQANKLLEAVGATPVGMPVPTFPEALSKGVVDGGVIPWQVVPGLKVHELADAHTEIGGDFSLYNIFFVWAMNNDSYNALPDDLKAIIDNNTGIDASGMAGRAMDIGDDKGLAATAATDNTILTMADEEVAQLREIGDALIAAWITEVTEKGLDGAAMVADAKAMIAAQ
ncbi:MAG: TRAP transporter substrate-binding protein [Rhodobacteraceae bacterium]|nr:TRAP transporter substrate-binding protein [Paracoccaceae bacterium]